MATATKAKRAKKSSKDPVIPGLEEIKVSDADMPGKGAQIDELTMRGIMKQLDKVFGYLDKAAEDDKSYEDAMKKAFGEPVEVHQRYGKKWIVFSRPKPGRDEDIRVHLGVRTAKDGTETISVAIRTWYEGS